MRKYLFILEFGEDISEEVKFRNMKNEKVSHMKKHRYNFYIMLGPHSRKGHGTFEELKTTQCKITKQE